MENRALYEEPIGIWGVESQMVMAIEEMAELTQQLTKGLRGQGTLDKLSEEIADVEIMLEQLRVMNPGCAKRADEWKVEKIVRLRKKLDESDSE